MGETLGSKSVFRVLFVFRCVCVVDVLNISYVGCCCLLLLLCVVDVLNCCCVLLTSLMVVVCC